MNSVLEKFRVTAHPTYGTKPGDNYGLFRIPIRKSNAPLQIMCAPMDSEWQHVSVSLPNRCPTWEEMATVKELFWGDDVTVIQFHPKKSEYVDRHPFCLHMWKKRDHDHELPPKGLV